MRLRDYAKQHGITYQTAWKQFKAGKIPGAYRLPTGTVCIEDAAIVGKTIVYARVSSAQNKSKLTTQAERVASFCAAKGWIVSDIVTEIGSGLNDDRKKLLKILRDDTVARIVIEHKDRLTRFGFNLLVAAKPACEFVVINPAMDDKSDLMQDFVAIVTSFCARLYGRRRTQRNTEKLIQELQHGD